VPLADAAEAHRLVDKGTDGKVVLRLDAAAPARTARDSTRHADARRRCAACRPRSLAVGAAAGRAANGRTQLAATRRGRSRCPQPHADADALVVRVQRVALGPGEVERGEPVDVVGDLGEPATVARAELDVGRRDDLVAESVAHGGRDPSPRLAPPRRDGRRVRAVPHLDLDCASPTTRRTRAAAPPPCRRSAGGC
jgi:hypothetical protein